jgi:hypothetical protein
MDHVPSVGHALAFTLVESDTGNGKKKKKKEEEEEVKLFL